MTGGLDQSARNVLRLEILGLTRKRIVQSPARFGRRPNLESTGSASSPFRRFAVSPFRPYSYPPVAMFGKREQTTSQISPSITSAPREPLISTARFGSRLAS